MLLQVVGERDTRMQVLICIVAIVHVVLDSEPGSGGGWDKEWSWLWPSYSNIKQRLTPLDPSLAHPLTHSSFSCRYTLSTWPGPIPPPRLSTGGTASSLTCRWVDQSQMLAWAPNGILSFMSTFPWRALRRAKGQNPTWHLGADKGISTEPPDLLLSRLLHADTQSLSFSMMVLHSHALSFSLGLGVETMRRPEGCCGSSGRADFSVNVHEETQTTDHC